MFKTWLGLQSEREDIAIVAGLLRRNTFVKVQPTLLQPTDFIWLLKTKPHDFANRNHGVFTNSRINHSFQLFNDSFCVKVSIDFGLSQNSD